MLPGVGPKRVLSEGMGRWGQGGAGGLGWKCLGWAGGWGQEAGLCGQEGTGSLGGGGRAGGVEGPSERIN